MIIYSPRVTAIDDVKNGINYIRVSDNKSKIFLLVSHGVFFRLRIFFGPVLFFCLRFFFFLFAFFLSFCLRSRVGGEILHPFFLLISHEAITVKNSKLTACNHRRIHQFRNRKKFRRDFQISSKKFSRNCKGRRGRRNRTLI